MPMRPLNAVGRALNFGFIRTLLIAMSTLLFATDAQAVTHNPYEITLGIFKNDVIEILGEPADKQSDASCCSDEQWNYNQGKIFFCKGRVTAVQIELSPNLKTFIRAIEEEKKARGEPEFSFDSMIGGRVKADWRIEPYRHLSISLDGNPYNSSLHVDRWLQDIKPCEK
ncbi:hypothetical protein AQZ52_10175 [Novosphingobium fuchskuhlense]|uniref:DUF2147 domain-containing protein n=1 Tax=Novosphingobium fuchskuhlense TaxID=1117702 RepID=A0A117UUF1_9SPHN|nr:hypothetical protein [Novosphingobium fuchskuhlense]KUR71052.1 hypothetical protein AQZ52_10175 [Novosphingobium fuchskuhlense]